MNLHAIPVFKRCRRAHPDFRRLCAAADTGKGIGQYALFFSELRFISDMLKRTAATFPIQRTDWLYSRRRRGRDFQRVCPGPAPMFLAYTSNNHIAGASIFDENTSSLISRKSRSTCGKAIYPCGKHCFKCHVSILPKSGYGGNAGGA
jgi:hypothetical protein